MAHPIRVNTLKVANTVRAISYGLIRLSLLEHSRITTSRAKVCMFGAMGGHITGTGKKTKWMELENLSGLMDGGTLASTKMIRKTGQAGFTGLMAECMMVSGSMANNTEMECMRFRVESQRKADGMKERGSSGSQLIHSKNRRVTWTECLFILRCTVRFL